MNKIHYDRCNQDVDGDCSPGFTSGYYNCKQPSSWAKFANQGEVNICDSCMWNDPRYIAVYGVVYNVS